MAAAPGGLTASIRRKLQDGKSPEAIVQELVAGGMTQVSAQRFVDRAALEQQTAPPLPPAPAPADSLDQFIQTKTAESEAAAAKTGRRSLWVASAFMCGGIVITGVSLMMADEGERFTLMWGPVVFGMFLWTKTVFQGVRNFRTFAWFSAVGSFLAPVFVAAFMIALIVITAPPLDEEESEPAAEMSEPATPSEPAPAADTPAPAVDLPATTLATSR